MADEGIPRSGFYADAESGVCYRNLDFMGFPGYRVGDDGSVWTCRKLVTLGGRLGSASVVGPRWRRLRGDQGGRYIRVRLKRNGSCARFLLHRLVLQCFAGPCPDGHECRHLNGTKANNNLANLAWGTPSQNAIDRISHGTLAVGGESNLAKLTEEVVRQIRCKHATKEANLKELAATYGVTPENISLIVRRKSWKHVA